MLSLVPTSTSQLLQSSNTSKSMAQARLCAWIAITTFAMATLPLLSASHDLSTYIIHMDLSAMPRAFAGHRGWYDAMLSAIVDSSDTTTTTTSSSSSSSSSAADDSLVYVYDTAVHGFCARLSPSLLKQLQRIPGFVSYHQDVLLRPDTTHTSEFLRLGPDSGLWPASHYGEDVIIGVVDSGVWPESESYRDEGMAEVPPRWKGACEEGTAFTASMCNRKLVGARFFNRGLLANRPNLTIRTNSARDTDGHGTHTSSTAAGSFAGGASYFGYAGGTARGMAPRARVAAYKVLWGEGAFASDIVAGIDRAIADGVDVISISLGLDGAPLCRDPVAVATFDAVERGVFVAASAGNQGPWPGLLHNGAPWQLTVGAGTVDRKFSGTVELGDGSNTVVGISLYPMNSASPPLQRLSLVSMGACSNKTSLHMAGYKIVVCETSGPLDSVVERVTSAGVAGALFITSSPYIEYNVHFTMPGAIVSSEDGKTILDYIRSSPEPRATLRFQVTTLGTRPAPVVATYTSRGPSSACPAVLKPDLLAPGSLVLAAWPNSTSVAVVGNRSVYSPFNIISGSSMACPHAAGVAALLRAAHPGWSPAAIRSAMMTTADVVDNTLQPIQDMGGKYRPATPLDMGAGHINPNRAMDPGLVYDAGAADYIRLLCAMNYTREQIHMITRSVEAGDCSAASQDLNYPSFIAFFGANETKAARVFRRTVTNVGEGKWTYRAKVAAMKGFAISVQPGVLVFKEKGEKQGFVLTLEGPAGVMKDEEVAHGWLSWEDEQGKHSVTSPVVATSAG